MTNHLFDQKDLLASLSNDERKKLQQKSDRAGCKRLAGHFGALLFLGLWIGFGFSYWQFVLLPYGILLVFLFTAQHEATHETAFSSRFLNVWVAHFIGFLLIVPPLWFRYFHFAHHRHTQDPDKDPELEGGKPETVWQYIKHTSGLPLWASMIKIVTSQAFSDHQETYVPDRSAKRVKQQARVMLMLYTSLLVVSLLLQTGLLLSIWVIPALIGQPFLRLYLMAEHGGCPTVSNMLENSRTTFTTSLVRYFAWNMPFHSEHHAMPTVPFHQLPNLHRYSAQHLKSVSNGYTEFHRETITTLR